MVMTTRENYISCLNRTGFERAMIDYDMCPSLIQQLEDLRKGTGLALNEYLKHDISTQYLGTDEIKHGKEFWQKYYKRPIPDGTTFGMWGAAAVPGGKNCFHMCEKWYPLADMDSLEQLQAYDWFEFNADHFATVSKQVKEIKANDRISVAPMACTIWETAWGLRGMENLMEDMLMEDEMAVYLLDQITDVQAKRAAEFARAGTDKLHLGDDVGMQHTMMMSPDFWREWLKPRLKKVIDAARSNAVGPLLISYHSCGFVEPIIEDFIELGIDILNPIQPECMNFEKLHSEYGDVISFDGTIGTQTTMPFGSPEDVRQEVLKNLDIAGSKGGLLCCPTHLLEPEVPVANIKAYVDACNEWSARQ